MSDSEVQQAYHHIAVFYGGQNVAASQEWLDKFAASMSAWTVCDRILSERRDALSCCFASQTIRQKILKSLKELPAESYLSLRESLIHHLSHIHPSVGDNLGESTLTQLCLSIADLYIQVPEWNNWVVELLNKCTTLEGDRTRMMLTLLRVFPEEIQSRSIRVGENRRKVIRDELAASATGVLSYLVQIMHQCQADEELVKRVFYCVAAYLGNPALCTDQIATSPLLAAAFQVLSMPSVSGSLHDAATECIVQATIIAEDHGAHLALATALQKHVFTLVEPYQHAVASEDMDKLINFARVFTEMNESLIERIVNDADPDPNAFGSLQALELLLLLAGHHDYAIIERTFNIWYRISEALFLIDDDYHVAKFRPYVNRYLTALYRHSRFDSDEEGIPDENSDFMGFRLKVVETVKDVVYIVGTDGCVRSMYNLLVSCSSMNGSWDEMEAALFIISAVVNNLLPEEESVVPQLVTAMAALPANSHPALIVTSIELLGGCDEWLQKHPQFHDQALHWLFTLTSNPMFSVNCSESIEKIVTRSSNTLVHLIDPLLTMVPALEASKVKGKQMERAIIGILRSITSLVMHLPEAEIHSKLSGMCAPIVTRLQKILDGSAVPAAPGGNKENEQAADSWLRISEQPMLWIDRIAAIFKEVKPWHKQAQVGPGGVPVQQAPAPWLNIADALYTVVSATMSRHEANARLVEHACRSIRYLVRSLGIQSQGFIEPVVTQMIDIYSRHKHSCFLYLASILVDEYGGIPSTQQGLIHMLDTLATGTFQFFVKDGDSQRQMRDNPDMVDDLFRLAGRFTLRAPSAFFVHPIANSLVDCALSALSLDHQQANRSVTRFFVDIIEQLMSARKAQYRDNGVAALEQILMTKGALLIANCLNAAIFSVTGALRRDMAEIISMVGKYDSARQREWLESACSQLPQGGLAATKEQLVVFVNSITQNGSQMGSRDVFGQIRDLSELYN